MASTVSQTKGKQDKHRQFIVQTGITIVWGEEFKIFLDLAINQALMEDVGCLA